MPTSEELQDRVRRRKHIAATLAIVVRCVDAQADSATDSAPVRAEEAWLWWPVAAAAAFQLMQNLRG